MVERTLMGIVDVSFKGNLLSSGHPASFDVLIPTETLAQTPIEAMTALQKELGGNLLPVAPNLQCGREMVSFSVPRAAMGEPGSRRSGQKLALLLSRHLGIEFLVQRS